MKKVTMQYPLQLYENREKDVAVTQVLSKIQGTKKDYILDAILFYEAHKNDGTQIAEIAVGIQKIEEKMNEIEKNTRGF